MGGDKISMINELPNEQQLFYKKDNQSSWTPSLDGTQWPEEKCSGYLHKHLTWGEFQAIVNPPKSNGELFAEEMDALNAEYDKNMAILANKYNIAVARDGSQETAKVESARAEISALDAQYESDQLAILNKYYGA